MLFRSGYSASPWYGMAGPARLPRPIVDRLNREVGEILRLPEVHGKFTAMDILLSPGTPESLTERVRTELATFTQVVRNAGIERE